MKIGIDIDNTITDTLSVMKKYCKKYNDEVVKRNLLMNEDGFAASNLYEWTDKEKEDFFNNVYEDAIEKVPLKENAREIIDRLKNEGKMIYIITARSKGKNPYQLTKNFLQRENVIYDELVLEKDKKQFCIDNNIDVLIDDAPQNINNVSQVIPVIVLNAKHNKMCKGINIIRVNTWGEVYDEIRNIKINKLKCV